MRKQMHRKQVGWNRNEQGSLVVVCNRYFFQTQWEACDSGLQHACFMPMTVFYGLVGDEGRQ